MEEMIKQETQNTIDEESAFPGTPLSSMSKLDVQKIVEDRKNNGGELNDPPIHYGYGHLDGKGIKSDLLLAKYGVKIDNPKLNPQWSEIMDDASKFAIKLCMEEDIQKIQNALHEFIDVEDSHSKFIRKALARSILKTEMKCRVKPTKIVVDKEKLKVKMDDPSDESLKKYLNDAFGDPYKKTLPNMDMASLYIDYMDKEDEK